MVVTFYENGKTLKDPTTGENLGYIQKDIAKGVIARNVGDTLSVCKITQSINKNLKIKKNSYLRFD